LTLSESVEVNLEDVNAAAKHKPQHLYVVLIGYGEADTRSARIRLEKMLSTYPHTLVVVDTSTRIRFDDGGDVNDAYEFSGYAFGLAEVCADFEKNGNTDSANNFCQVVMLNSTAFTAHISLMTRAFLHYACSSFYLETTRRTAIGLRWAVGSPIEDVATLGWYFATHLFCIRGSIADLRAVRFYEKKQILRLIDTDFHHLPREYNQAILRWLSPQNMFDGWYKASPFLKLPRAELTRKRVTIYLEHSLPLMFTNEGFKCVAANVDSAPRYRWLFRLLISIDRMYINMRKLNYRGRLLVVKAFRKYPANDN
jgi:hypothetical protein